MAVVRSLHKGFFLAEDQYNKALDEGWKRLCLESGKVTLVVKELQGNESKNGISLFNLRRFHFSPLKFILQTKDGEKNVWVLVPRSLEKAQVDSQQFNPSDIHSALLTKGVASQLLQGAAAQKDPISDDGDFVDGDAANTEAQADNFWKFLSDVPNKILKSVQGNFTREDARKELVYVKDHNRVWETEQSGWDKVAGVEIKRIKRKDVRGNKLPRTLTVVRKKKADTDVYEVIHVFVHFNKSFGVNKDGSKQYEGYLGDGADNIVKLLFDLKEKKFATIRRTKENSSNSRAKLEVEVQSEVESANVEKVRFSGEVLKKDGRTRFMTIRDLAFRDAFKFDTKTMTELKRLKFARDLVKGAKAIFDKGIAHRDLKPENVLLDRDWKPQITDFGFATKEYEQYKDGEKKPGTPGFFHPHLDLLKDKRNADKWALGVTLWKVLYNEHLPDIMNLYSLDPSQKTLENAILRLVQEKEDRMSSYEDVINDINDLIKKEEDRMSSYEDVINDINDLIKKEEDRMSSSSSR